MDEGLSVGEVAEEVGLSAYTLRWYEQVGLIDPVPRDTARRRRYRASDVERLNLLTKMRATGMPVRDMISYVEMIRRGDSTRQERLMLLEAHRYAVLKQIDELQRDLSVIDRKITMYRGYLSDVAG